MGQTQKRRVPAKVGENRNPRVQYVDQRLERIGDTLDLAQHVADEASEKRAEIQIRVFESNRGRLQKLDGGFIRRRRGAEQGLRVVNVGPQLDEIDAIESKIRLKVHVDFGFDRSDDDLPDVAGRHLGRC